jgi:hypothetical protein
MPQIIIDHDDALCPSCERYIGLAGECPYCDADSYKGGLIRKMRALTLLTSAFGVAMLCMSFAFRSIPALNISEITPGMNGRTVSVSGTVDGKAAAVGQDGRRSITINDKTGRIRIVLDDDADIGPSGKLKQGRRLVVTGRIRIGPEGRVYLAAVQGGVM